MLHQTTAYMQALLLLSHKNGFWGVAAYGFEESLTPTCTWLFLTRASFRQGAVWVFIHKLAVEECSGENLALDIAGTHSRATSFKMTQGCRTQ